MNIPLILLAISALADVYTSHRAFKRGNIELNPLVAKLFGLRPKFGAMLAVKAVAFVAIVYVASPTWMFAAAAAWGAAAVWNATR